MSSPRVVVGAVLVRDGRVLAARRTTPPVGRWEFPGGKVEPGEAATAALVREVREELGCDVVVGQELTDAGRPWPISAELELRLFWAGLVDDQVPRPGVAHDRLRWLRAHELDDVDWLPSDRRAVDLLARGPGLLTPPEGAASFGRSAAKPARRGRS